MKKILANWGLENSEYKEIEESVWDIANHYVLKKYSDVYNVKREKVKNRDYDRLKDALPGLEPEMSEPFYMLAEVLDYEAFELCEVEQNTMDRFIPYMMNDAVECYLILKNVRIQGFYDKKLKDEKIWAELLREGDSYALLVHQGEDHVFSLWFQEIEKRQQCYQYHNIGHFWVKGQEQWRQLVYMVGTMEDKYRYLGSEVCNPAEEKLRQLIHFAPFRRWSPIEDLMEEQYPETVEGIQCMMELAAEAEDREYLRWLRFYEKHPGGKLEVLLSKKLLSPKRQKLYCMLYEKIREASKAYQERSYGKSMDALIMRKREMLEENLRADGYHGSYPEYQKKGNYILVTEEQPFTILEWEDYGFRMQLMKSKCQEMQPGRNAGFFNGRGRSGQIQKVED